MTQDEWLSSTADPAEMLAFLRTRGMDNDRKLRLFACACVRTVWPWLVEARSQKVVKVAEQYADRVVSASKLASVLASAKGASRALVNRRDMPGRLQAAALVLHLGFAMDEDAAEVAKLTAELTDPPSAATPKQAVLLRDLFGPLPFREVHLDPSLLTWNNGSIGRMAEAVYEDREMPSGVFRTQLVARLVEALEQAGCRDADVMDHLRQPDGVHVRGCWCVDLLLGKA